MVHYGMHSIDLPLATVYSCHCADICNPQDEASQLGHAWLPHGMKLYACVKHFVVATCADSVLAKYAAPATSCAEGRGVGRDTPSSAELVSAPSIDDVMGCIISFSQLQTVKHHVKQVMTPALSEARMQCNMLVSQAAHCRYPLKVNNMKQRGVTACALPNLPRLAYEFATCKQLLRADYRQRKRKKTDLYAKAAIW